jgi:DNA/RNA endonuclease YhcR with UshA esterase domain
VKIGRAAGLVFLDFSQDRTSLAVVCPIDAWSRFPDGFEHLYAGKKIWVCGTIESYQGQPEIVLHDPSQIRIVDNSARAALIPSDKNLIQWTEAAKSLGTVKTVEGLVVSTARQSSLVLLDFTPNKTGFEVICRRDAWSRFPDAFEQLYAGKKVWVCGLIESYKGRPEILLSEPSQIQIMGERGPLATTRGAN